HPRDEGLQRARQIRREGDVRNADGARRRHAHPSEGRKLMAVKLHRCPNIWVKLPGHPCWKVQKALDEQGIDYEIVKEEWRGDRTNTVEHTGQKKYPWIEFEAGSFYREESKDMAETIRAGRLNEKRGTGSAAPASPETRLDFRPRGAIAQWGERLDRTQEVAGSSPASSTRKRPAQRAFSFSL